MQKKRAIRYKVLKINRPDYGKLLYPIYFLLLFLILFGNNKLILIVFLCISYLWYKKYFRTWKRLRTIRANLLYFMEINKFYEAEFLTKYKDNSSYKKKHIIYHPLVRYAYLEEGTIEIQFGLDGSPISSKHFRNLAEPLADCFHMPCDEIIEEQGFVKYFLSKGYSPLKVNENTNYLHLCSEEKMLLANGLWWDFRKSPHALITGGTGSGKTMFLVYILKCVQSIGADVKILDPKRSDLLKIGDKWGVGTACEGNQIAKILREANEEMDRRYDKMSEIGTDYSSFGMKPVFIVFDEVMAFMGGTQDNKLIKEVNGYLMNIIAKGRQSGVFMVLALQRPDVKFLEGALRDQLGLRIALGNLSDDGMTMIFGSEYKHMRPCSNVVGAGIIFLSSFRNTRPKNYITPRMENVFKSV